ncbi:MAG TPA: UpxY family transcription antiterminator [Terriglobales bacterium]|nr:UpxY family transcription antiterminator [Terriglobales bacterium]
MSSEVQIVPAICLAEFSLREGESSRWYAVHTRCHHEKAVDMSLQHAGIKTFLPLVKEVHRWSDRRKTVDVVLFPCYTFVHIDAHSPARVQVLKTPGVLQLVGGRAGPTPIADFEIEQVQKVLAERLSFSPFPFLIRGERVRVRGGALDGVEGILSSHVGAKTIIISVTAIERSLSLAIEGYDLEAA